MWTRGRLRRLPEGQVLGVPVELGPLLRSGVLPPGAVARAGLDLVLPRRRPGLSADPSVAEVIGSRMGQGVVDRLVEPLVGGINAGRADDLSLAATAPQLAEAATGSRSLILGLRRRRQAPSVTTGPLFLGIAGGLGRLVDRLAAGLAEAGVEICTGTAVTAIEPDGAGRRRVPGRHRRRGDAGRDGRGRHRPRLRRRAHAQGGGAGGGRRPRNASGTRRWR